MLLVTSGKTTTGEYIPTSEVIDLEDSKSTCQSLPDYTLGEARETGGLLKDIPIICNLKSWSCDGIGQSFSASTPNNHYNSAAVVIQDSIWITGGSMTSLIGSNTSVLVHSNQTVSKGPNLPLLIAYHCSVKINPDEVYIIGGRDQPKSSHKYNFNTNRVIQY